MKSHQWPRPIAAVGLVVLTLCFSSSLRAADAPAAKPSTRPSVIRLACVGDSITFGSGLKDRHAESYPSQLQGMLGKGWDVQNFGVSGTTLLKKGDRSYWDQKRFAAAEAFAPDVVVIKLGTNDSKPQNWKFKDDFRGDLTALIEEFRALPNKPTVWLCRPVPAFPGKYGIRDEVIREEILPMIDAVGKVQKTPVIDLYGALSGKSEHFPDTIHPNAEGARLMALEVYKSLTGSPYKGVAQPSTVPTTR